MDSKIKKSIYLLLFLCYNYFTNFVCRSYEQKNTIKLIGSIKSINDNIFNTAN